MSDLLMRQMNATEMAFRRGLRQLRQAGRMAARSGSAEGAAAAALREQELLDKARTDPMLAGAPVTGLRAPTKERLANAAVLEPILEENANRANAAAAEADRLRNNPAEQPAVEPTKQPAGESTKQPAATEQPATQPDAPEVVAAKAGAFGRRAKADAYRPRMAQIMAEAAQLDAEPEGELRRDGLARLDKEVTAADPLYGQIFRKRVRDRKFKS